MPVALVSPTLPLTLLGHTAGWQSSLSELELRQQLAAFLVDAGRTAGLSVLNVSSLATAGPEAARFDPGMDLQAGFPYALPHASEVASGIVKLLFPPPPMKGLITDLDETFWSGIVGEVGASGVSWTLAEHAQIHGAYQQVLRNLAETGVLLAAASKNEASTVEQALAREDLLLPAKSLFPVIANWGPKSASVAEILTAWNIGAESVVFVDDSPMELEEVRTAFPAMTCLLFSKKRPAATFEMFRHLRDLFGKSVIHLEDTFRQGSIRANAAFQAAASTGGQFVRTLMGKVTFNRQRDPANKRLLELINKTNQFNLNGIRISEGEWMRFLADPANVAVGVSYDDKFGPLGTIGVAAGTIADRHLDLSVWVMSCRAFSRQIEYHTLRYLFDSCGVDSISLLFKPTGRNAPLQEFLQRVGVPLEAGAQCGLSRERFSEGCHEFPHEVAALEEDPNLSGPKGRGVSKA